MEKKQKAVCIFLFTVFTYWHFSHASYAKLGNSILKPNNMFPWDSFRFVKDHSGVCMVDGKMNDNTIMSGVSYFSQFYLSFFCKITHHSLGQQIMTSFRTMPEPWSGYSDFMLNSLERRFGHSLCFM